MDFNNNDIKLSYGDKNNNITLPIKLDNKLAYFIGIHMGDGNLFQKDYHNKLTMTGHLYDEKEFYINNIIPLIKELFGNEPLISENPKDTTIQLVLNSKSTISFLNKKTKLVIGPKTNQKIPEIIREEFIIDFLKGMADTDFCLTFKKRYKNRHYYPTISFGTTDKNMVEQIYNLLLNVGIKSSLTLSRKGSRKGEEYLTNEINIYGVKKLEKWMKIIGFRSSKHLTKYKVWRKYGYCPPDTTFLQRKQILSGEEPIENFYK